MHFPILSTLIFLPILAAILLLVVNLKNSRGYYIYGLFISLLNLVLSCKLLFLFDKKIADFQFTEIFSFISNHDIKYFVGIDGISLLMIVLTAFLTPICLALSINSIQKRVKEFVIAFLLIEGLVIGAFCALDLLFFYIFFEAMLIPMFLVIGIWGGENRIYAAYKFFLYTLFGSVLFLIAIILIYIYTGTTDIVSLSKGLKNFFPLPYQKWFFLAFFASFAVKVPMFPFHTWLPDAHVQAPTAGSVILAGILIKLGAYGFLRFSLPFFPAASQYFANFIFVLSVIAIIYASLVALMQEDMKKMIAYSSVAHMGFVTMGIFSFTRQGIDGAIMQMISHGIVSAALFACVGVIYDRLHTKQIKDLGGIANKMPNFAMLAMIFTLASVGLPGTSGFVGEFLSIVGTFKANKIVAILATSGVVLGACYMLWLYKRVWFSEIHNQHIGHISDLGKTELISLGLMALFVILLGILPNLALSFFELPSAQLANLIKP
ncbi:MAG: NADH-quinone oxidoreductase subunit M [Alphaproteobacteria bacterium RIFCSPLOWO2_01_FULL_40_26]|nr:MAG: NADH-quinone oxidoreductase subunit M [Alphaproteobacteria bacterium RIFCSPHIGHO2_02_FULL_40_34]OFW95487.1 MAG: NADH-quinone oxidoreductase subunit M [Alphaproteobacteria bacterium RIFCSPLOWO2_01_FULL_40_26]OFX09333.1 MAG: NADH-quinone oxidoreductase subunit M [Alphaproteobacteria bacterium RIFCSPLOWO2_02_FULL_40_19]OFX10946.1 MAG: NADH-quinone oxidoreductase subunit M [Alphaproteobacteria bacterium RIFCSPLOWO2_12_FULL_40_11]